MKKDITLGLIAFCVAGATMFSPYISFANTSKVKTVSSITYNKIKFEQLDPKKAPSNLISKIQKYKTKSGFLFITDKNGYTYIAILNGKKNTSGYSISVKSVEDCEGKTNIAVHESSPLKGSMVTQAITYPYTIIRATGITPNITIKNDLGIQYKNLNKLNPNDTHEIIGVSQKAGTLKSIQYVGENVYINIIDENNRPTYYFASKGSSAEKSLNKFKMGDFVLVKYALGTPSKIGDSSAFPFSLVTKVDE